MSEMLYANAPLVEVIAEIRWKTIKLTAIPNGGVDPYYEVFLQAFRSKAKELGFAFEEKVVPDEVPREFLAGQVTTRFRPEPNKWPVFQVGPGIFTANVIPPYDGWTSFAPTVNRGIQAMLDCYPESGKLLVLERMSLKYIDAFTASHSRRDSWSFLSQGIQHKVTPPPALSALDWIDGTPRDVTLNMEYAVSKPEKSVLASQISSGKANGVDATIFTLDMILPKIERTLNVDTIIQWYSDAHGALSEAFGAIISDDVRNAMGPVREVKPK